ncbi:MAG: SMI1/KNR4 family protein [Planctomycetota bacterium]
MAAVDADDLKRAIERVFALNQRYYDLIDAGLPHALAPPADAVQIEELERTLGGRLPPSYRLFLSFHDGWKHWEGDMHLLSVAEQQVGPYAEWIRDWKLSAWDEGDAVILEGAVIGARLGASRGLVLDTRKRDDRGEMEIVNWSQREIARYADFLELLEQTARDLEAIIAEEAAEQG